MPSNVENHGVGHGVLINLMLRSTRRGVPTGFKFASVIPKRFSERAMYCSKLLCDFE